MNVTSIVQRSRHWLLIGLATGVLLVSGISWVNWSNAQAGHNDSLPALAGPTSDPGSGGG